jgi:replicative DNA helicase
MPERFLSDEKMRMIWRAIVKLYKKKEVIDMVTVTRSIKVSNRMDDDSARALAVEIAEIINDAPMTSHVNTYYHDVLEEYKIKRIKSAKTTKDVQGLMESAKKYEIKTQGDSKLFETLSKTVVENSMVVEDNPFTWTVDYINKTMGRPVPGAFYVIAGESGVGKSILATDMALENSDNANIAFFSLEMEKTDFLQDYVHTKIGKIRDDIMTKNYEVDDMIKARKTEKMLNESTVAFIDDTGMEDAGVDINVSEIIKLCDDNGVNMVFMDSLSKLRAPSEKSHVEEARVTDILAKWRNRRMEEGNPITIFLIHHLDKNGDKVAGSAKIEQDCTGMIKLSVLSKDDGTITWTTGKLRKNRYCKRTLKQHEGGLIDSPWQ